MVMVGCQLDSVLDRLKKLALHVTALKVRRSSSLHLITLSTSHCSCRATTSLSHTALGNARLLLLACLIHRQLEVFRPMQSITILLSGSEWKSPLCGRITYQHCRQPKHPNFLYSSNCPFGGRAADTGNATPTFCFSVSVISKLITLTVESLWTVPT